MYMKFDLNNDEITSEFEGAVTTLAAGVMMIARNIYAGLGDDDRELFRACIIKGFTEYPGTWDVSDIKYKARANIQVTPGTKGGPLS